MGHRECVLDVERTYLNLISDLERVAVQEKAVELAERLLMENKSELRLAPWLLWMKNKPKRNGFDQSCLAWSEESACANSNPAQKFTEQELQ